MKKILTLSLLAAPSVSFAAEQQVSSLKDLIELVIRYMGYAIPFILTLSTIVFIWGIYKYYIKGGGEDRAAAGMYVLYGIIGFFVMLSFWGLVNVVRGTINVGDNQNIRIPYVQYNGGGVR